ncbi:uncharacterized protein G2W53_040900 [Senna tora]|uniref:Uncharacterized protein n=1 Tax=Senna tora TaxID=362788 RepID=A0A834SED9_9FABA|nr:uncharacterized protein G2W53_040900 [Senna tora]
MNIGRVVLTLAWSLATSKFGDQSIVRERFSGIFCNEYKHANVFSSTNCLIPLAFMGSELRTHFRYTPLPVWTLNGLIVVTAKFSREATPLFTKLYLNPVLLRYGTIPLDLSSSSISASGSGIFIISRVNISCKLVNESCNRLNLCITSSLPIYGLSMKAPNDNLKSNNRKTKKTEDGEWMYIVSIA